MKEEAGIVFSVRMRLVHKNVPVNQTIQIYGHMNVNSINSYIHIISWQAKQISHILWTFHQPGMCIAVPVWHPQPAPVASNYMGHVADSQEASCRPDSGSDCYNRQSLVRWYTLCSKFHFNFCLHVMTCSSTTWRRDLFHWIENCYAIICSSISIQICFLFII